MKRMVGAVAGRLADLVLLCEAGLLLQLQDAAQLAQLLEDFELGSLASLDLLVLEDLQPLPAGKTQAVSTWLCGGYYH
jgi:hypothetical protein